MAQPILPDGAQVGFPELAEVIRQSPELLHVDPFLTVWTLLAETRRGDLEHYGTVLRLGEGVPPQAESRVTAEEVGYVRLLKCVRHVEAVRDTAALHGILGFWGRHSSSRFGGFSGDPYIEWQASGSDPNSSPNWTASVPGESRGQIDPSQFRSGPLLDERLSFFAPTVEAAAATWLGRAMAHDVNRYRVVIPDQRAKIETIKVEGSQLSVTVRRRTEGRLLCAIRASPYDGPEVLRIEEVAGTHLMIELDRTPRSLEISLHDAERRQIDRFEENESGSSWGASILTPARGGTGPSIHHLDHALSAGEGEHIEFKPLVLGGRGNHKADSKVREILETVVALANADGGSIYLGVDDYGNLSGSLDQVFRHVEGAAHGDPSQAKDRFAGDLRRIIAEGVAPSIRVTLDWVDRATHLVLRVGVPAGLDRPYYVIDRTGYFVRRGATNRPMPPEEMERIYRERFSRA